MPIGIHIKQRRVSNAYVTTQQNYKNIMITNKLNWQQGNAKLPNRIIHFSLASGHSCPAAKECLSKADPITGKITDGPDTIYRCFAATMEARHSAVRRNRNINFNILRKCTSKQMFTKLHASLKPLHDKYIKNHDQRPIIRSHIGGDFFNKSYFLAWMRLANEFKPTQFYAYTKRIDLWLQNLDQIPSNFELNASRGGRFDHLIDEHSLKSAEVVYSYEEAERKKLELDHDDSHAYLPGKSFGQLIHGTQPAGSDASKALRNLSKNHGYTGYSAAKSV